MTSAEKRRYPWSTSPPLPRFSEASLYKSGLVNRTKHIVRQSTDRSPTVDRYSADNQRSTYRPLYRPRYLPIVGQYVDHHSVDISVGMSVDMSTDTSRYFGRGVHKIHMSVDMSTDISVEGCTKYTWFPNLVIYFLYLSIHEFYSWFHPHVELFDECDALFAV